MGNFLKIHAEDFSLGLKPVELMVYSLIKSYTVQGLQCFISAKTLAEQLNVSKNTILNTLKHLEDLKLIENLEQGHGKVRKFVAVDDVKKEEETQPKIGATEPNFVTTEPKIGATEPNFVTVSPTQPKIAPTEPNFGLTEPKIGSPKYKNNYKNINNNIYNNTSSSSSSLNNNKNPPSTNPVDKEDDHELLQDEDKYYHQAVRLHERYIGAVREFESEIITELLKDFGFEWYTEAFREMAKSNAQSLRYVEKVLMNWKEYGYKTRKGGENAGYNNHAQGKSKGSTGQTQKRRSHVETREDSHRKWQREKEKILNCSD